MVDSFSNLFTRRSREPGVADTLQQLLRERAEQDTIAVKYGDRTWTWREHIAEASAQAAALIAIGRSGRGRCTSARCSATPPTC